MEIVDTIRECNKHWNSYEEWNNAIHEKHARKKHLFDAYKKTSPDEYKKLKLKSETVLRTVNILDNASENAAENMQVATEAVSGALVSIPILSIIALSLLGTIKACNHYEKYKKMPFYFYLSLFYAPVFECMTDLPLVFWKTRKQIEASRVARAKAKEEELRDEKNFVIYTKEQTEQAKKIAETIPDKVHDEDEKNISLRNAFKATMSLDKEYSKYLKKYNENIGIDKKFQDKLNRDYSEKELLEAKKEKELLLNTVKEINNNAEKYCENAEAAFETMKLLNFLAVIPSIFIINKIVNFCFPKSNELIKKAISLYVPILATLPINVWMNNKQKEAAKVGRFKMKQKLTEDLSSLAYFDENELQKINNVDYKPEKLNIAQKVIRNLKFIPKYLNEREEYLEYKKTGGQEEEKLNKALKSIPVTEEQKKEAKKLQEKIFFVFDEIDEMSQKYSENMEGTIAFSKKILNLTKITGLMTAIALPVYMFLNGNWHVSKLIKTFSNVILNKESQLKKNINEIYEIAKNDKNIKSEIDNSLSFANNTMTKLLNEPKIAKQLQNISEIIKNAMMSASNRKEFTNKELKNGFVAKWFRNIALDVLQLGIKKIQKMPESKINKINEPNITNLLQNLKTSNIKISNLKTLKLTGLMLAIPCVAATISVSYLLNTFFAYLQKKAGYIGVMKAIKKIDNPKYFVSEKNQNNEQFSKKNLFAMLHSA